MSRNIEDYYRQYMKGYGFEKVMVAYRRKLVIERICKFGPSTIVEVGCGSELLYQYYLQQNEPVEKWIIVEPAADFAALAHDSMLPNLYVIESTLEQAVEQIAESVGKAPDMIVCSGLLHEVIDAQLLMSQIASLMDSKTLLHVNVPNARSMHRRLALAMGLIDDLKQLGIRNNALQQHRVYDFDLLKIELENVGLCITETGGYFVKPFTHEQMDAITEVANERVIEGLYQLGRMYPEWGSEIFCEARRA